MEAARFKPWNEADKESFHCPPPLWPTWLSDITTHDLWHIKKGLEVPSLLLYICSTTINNSWNPKNLLCEASGWRALWQSLHTHVFKVPTVPVIEEFSVCSKQFTFVAPLLEGNKGEWLQKEWKGKRWDVIRQASDSDSHFATHAFFKSLHQFCAAKFKGPLKLRKAPYLLGSSPHLPRWSQLTRPPWSYNFSSPRSSMCFVPCHHLKEVFLPYYSLLQHL